MADTGMADILKQFAQNITATSVTKRKKILGDLVPCVEKADFPEPALKGVYRRICVTLERYDDAPSRRAVADVIRACAATHAQQSVKLLPLVLNDLANGLTKLHPCPYHSGVALSALNWSCIIVRVGLKGADQLNGDGFRNMVSLQAQLVHVAQASDRKAISNSAYLKLRRIWKEIPTSAVKYAEVMASLEGSVYNFTLIGCIMKFFQESKDKDNLAKFKGTFVECYLKHVLGSRTGPPAATLSGCRPLLMHVDHATFKESILPAVDKAMLRNPEVILGTYSALLQGLTLDLSQYVDQLSKHLATHCHSQIPSLRDIAVYACRHLAKQCSDSGAVSRMVKYFFKVLNGSEGKLSGIDQRVGMLAAIGNLSYHTVSGSTSVQALSGEVAEMFIPVLQQEVHEGTLVHAVAMLTQWCSKFTTEVPVKVRQWIQTGLALKTSTALVRNAYIHCIDALYKGDTLPQATELVPLLKNLVEKAATQNTGQQLPNVCEAVNAACFLAKLAAVDINTEGKLTGFWTIITDANKPLFTNDKFLASAPQDALQCVATLAEHMVLAHHQKLSPAMTKQYYSSVVWVLTHGPYEQRRHAASCVKKMVSVLGGATISTAMVQEFTALLNTQTIEEYRREQESENPDAVAKMIPPRVLAESVMTLSDVPSADPTEANAIAMETLYAAHHPCIMEYNCDVWTDILFRLKLDAAKVVKDNIENIMSHLKNAQTITKCDHGAVGTISRICHDTIMPTIVSHVCSVLGNSELLTVTRREYEIMQHPEGELYDKSIIESGGREEASAANMRRENKLYSYEDQKAELELKKELERKKQKEGGGKKPEVKLTKKQHEAMAAQLAKESEIRAKTKQLDGGLANAIDLLDAMVTGNPYYARLHLPVLVRALVSLMPSPLAAPRTTQAFLKLRDSAFDEEMRDLGELISEVSLRLVSPSCHLSQGWSEEPLSKQTIRAVTLLHSLTTSSTSKQAAHQSLLPAPTLAYCFPLIQRALKRGGEAIGGDQEVMAKILDVISQHAQLRSTEQGDEDAVDQMGPELLPREEMLRICASVVATSSGSLQQTAAQALLDTAVAASGNEGCAFATQAEVSALLDSLQAPASSVREASLQALLVLEQVLPALDTDYPAALLLTQRVWVGTFDVEPENAKLAERLWGVCELDVVDELCCLLVEDVVHQEDAIREAAAEALAAALHKHTDQVPVILQMLMEVYEERLFQPPPILDSFGRVISESPPDQWPARSGLALAIGKLSPDLTPDQIPLLFTFMVEKGLGDRNDTVRKHMLQAAVIAVNDHGKSNVNTLLPVFEDFLASAPNIPSLDAVRQSIVILMGSLAKHLDKTDPKVQPIVAKLIETLSTPSHLVQEAVANCLYPLVPAIKEDAPDIVRKLLQLLLESENYGERKGAAYGLAGLVRGLGVLSLKQLDIMKTLNEAMQNKKNPRCREGALFAFEMLCHMLARSFEPYVVHILPHLLLCFGDNNQYVREAADDCAKAVMRHLSGHGVKQILPSLLSGIEEDSWRTKTGSVELLGAMAFCAPKQLSACLPSIVPKLTEVLTDSHLKVQKAGAQALKQIGSVIRNPEIQAIVPILLEALQDPTKKTTKCLTKLLETKFIHFIDAPSLALIMPVVQRSFQDRSTETRKMAAQIIGNMYSLTDQKDLSPYLPAVIPGLKQCLLDPVPEVRAVSSHALGAMVKGMGEAGFEELVPWLMETLTAENNSVDRSGAAQGLSEVVGGCGVEKLRQLMPEIIQTAERDDIAPHVRDGYIMMYIFLPNVFGDKFIEYVGPAIPSILKALADENEYVRETALRAGQRIVNMYADTAIELLLPELEKGLFDENWRIRYSSVQLLGDLLYLISGVTGKMTTESASEDDNFGTENSQQAILRTLGMERRNRVLAGLYMGRSDTALMVRQAALHVWKVIVTHTPKTLREILSTLFHLLLGCLASTSYDKRQVAARTLGDIVRKLGEKVLPEIIPILEKGLESAESDERQGVCIGLSEIMCSTSKEHVIVFADSLIPTVRKALIDPLPEVREAAASTFDNLHGNIGSRALDEILPFLLRQLNDDEQSEYALDGLKQVMAVKSRVVLPYLVPVLTRTPVNTRALSFFSSVAGDSLTKHLNKILPALMSALSESIGTPDESQELQYCQTVVLSVHDDMGLRTVIDELLGATANDNAGLRWAAVTILQAYCGQTKVDYLDYLPQLFRGIVRLFTDDDPRVLTSAWDCLSAITKGLDANEMLNQIPNMRLAVRYAVSDFPGDLLPGFCLPKKGITPILPLYREGLINGAQDQKEQAASGLGEVIRRTSADALKPSVVNITGPLIRILGDRFSFSVKVAVLETLALLLAKCGAMLKPFLPQLQTTFIKALNDPNRAVRIKAASALSQLIVIHPRVDPVFTELHSGIKGAEDQGVRDTMLQGLRHCIAGAGHKMGDKLRKELTGTLEGFLSAPEDSTRTTAAACMGTLCSCLKEDELAMVLNLQLLDADTSQEWTLRHGRAVALGVAISTAAEKLVASEEWKKRVSTAVHSYCAADRVPVCLSGLRALGYLLRWTVEQNQSPQTEHLTVITKCLKQESNDIKQVAALICSYMSHTDAALSPAVLKTLVPMLVNGTKEKNTLVRTNSELALVTMLRLRHADDDTYQTCLSSLESGMKDSLSEAYNKNLKKIAAQVDNSDDSIDDTILV